MVILKGKRKEQVQEKQQRSNDEIFAVIVQRFGEAANLPAWATDCKDMP
jgi:hypothetical protein